MPRAPHRAPPHARLAIIIDPNLLVSRSRDNRPRTTPLLSCRQRRRRPVVAPPPPPSEPARLRGGISVARGILPHTAPVCDGRRDPNWFSADRGHRVTMVAPQSGHGEFAKGVVFARSDSIGRMPDRWWLVALSWRGCAGVDVGLLVAQGFGFDLPTTSNAARSGIRAASELALPVSDRIALPVTFRALLLRPTAFCLCGLPLEQSRKFSGMRWLAKSTSRLLLTFDHNTGAEASISSLTIARSHPRRTLRIP